LCQSHAYLVEANGEETLVMEDVSVLKPKGDTIVLIGMFGEQKEIKARIKELQLTEHRILLEKS